MGKLQGKVILITGGSSGIGTATARLFHAEGGTVITTGSSEKSVAAARALLPGVDLRVSDASNINAAHELANAVVAQYGRIDVLFLNAGIAELTSIDQFEEHQYDKIFDTNVKGAYFLAKHVVPHMPDGGAIVLTGSVAGSTGGRSGTSVYGASKAALRSLGRTLAREFASRRIRVNTISPGPIDTQLLERNGYTPEQKQAYIESLETRVPLGRMGLPEEVAAAALFLAVDATYTTGAELRVDGGMVDL